MVETLRRALFDTFCFMVFLGKCVYSNGNIWPDPRLQPVSGRQRRGMGY